MDFRSIYDHKPDISKLRSRYNNNIYLSELLHIPISVIGLSADYSHLSRKTFTLLAGGLVGNLIFRKPLEKLVAKI